VRRPLVDDGVAHGGEMKASRFFLPVLALMAILLPWRAGANSGVTDVRKVTAGKSTDSLAEKVDLDRKAAAVRQSFDEYIVQQFGRDAGQNSSPIMREKIAKALFHQFIKKKADSTRDIRDIPVRRGESVIISAMTPYLYDVAVQRYNEIDRRYGQDESPVTRAVIAETLVEKARMLTKGIPYKIYSNDSFLSYVPLDKRIGRNYMEYRGNIYARVFPVFDEIERRFSQEKYPPIKSQYIRSLVEKARFWNDENPGVEISAYDEIVRRFGDDKSPEVRVQVAAALLWKGDVLWQIISENIVNGLVIRIGKQELAYFAQRLQEICPAHDEVQQLIAFGKNDVLQRDGSAWGLSEDKRRRQQVRIDVASTVLDKCWKYNIQDAVAIYMDAISCDSSVWEEYLSLDEHRALCIARGAFSRDHRIASLPSDMFLWKKNLRKCGARDAGRILAVYDKIERRFMESGDHEMRRKATDALVSQCGKPDSQEAAVVYEEIERRFGEDKDPDVQNQVGEALLRKIDALRKSDSEAPEKETLDTDTVIAAYDEINQRFGKNNPRLRFEIVHRLSGVGLRFVRDRREVVKFFTTNEHFQDKLVQWFADDDDTRIQSRVMDAWFAKGKRLSDAGNFDAAIGVYDEIVRHLDELERRSHGRISHENLRNSALYARDAAKTQRLRE
jgi:hypothetical protein